MKAAENLAPPPPCSGREAFFRHYGSTVLGQGLLLGLGTITGILVARMLGPAHRGELQAIAIWPLAIASILGMGVNQSLAFHLGRRSYSISETSTAAVVLGLAQGALALLIGLTVAHFALARYSPAIQHLGVLFVLFTPIIILTGYPANLFQGLQDPLRFNIIRTTSTVIYLAGILAVYFTHSGSVATAMWSQLASYVVALAAGVLMVKRYLKPAWQWNRTAIPRFLHYGFRVQATSLTNYVNQRLDQMILSLFVPPRQLGLYVVAVTLSTAVTVFPQAAGIVTFGRGSAQSREEAIRTLGVSFRASLLWLVVCCGLLFVLAPYLIRLAFGAAYEGSILACRILIPGALMIGLNQVMYNGSSALGRPGLPSIAEGISMGVTGVGLYILVPRYGFVGAAIVSTIAYTITFCTMVGLNHALLGVTLRDLLRRQGSRETAVRA